jgi:hypothetical protein
LAQRRDVEIAIAEEGQFVPIGHLPVSFSFLPFHRQFVPLEEEARPRRLQRTRVGTAETLSTCETRLNRIHDVLPEAFADANERRRIPVTSVSSVLAVEYRVEESFEIHLLPRVLGARHQQARLGGVHLRLTVSLFTGEILLHEIEQGTSGSLQLFAAVILTTKRTNKRSLEKTS